MIARVPPPSMLRMLTPLVGGLTATLMSRSHARLQRKHDEITYVHGRLDRVCPKIWIQVSQRQCPQGSRYCGVRRMQHRQVASLQIRLHLSTNCWSVCKCRDALGTSVPETSESQYCDNLPWTSLRTAERRIISDEPSKDTTRPPSASRRASR